MKQILKLFYLIIIGCYFSQAHADLSSMIIEQCDYLADQAPSEYGYLVFGVTADCTTYSTTCYPCQIQDNYTWVSATCAVRSCEGCIKDYMVPTEPTLVNFNSNISISEDVYVSHGCELYLCSNDPTCVSDTSYKSGNTGYEYKINRSCSGNQCVESRVYRCASGYYGSSSNGTTGCNRCPTDSKTGVTGTSSAGTTSITGCYQIKGKSFTDSTGTFEYVENCKYQN